jgi:hypothetical protein
MRLLPTVRRSALAAALLLVPALAVLSFDRWPSQPALADSTVLADDAAVESSTPAITTAAQSDNPITLQNWEDTDRPQKEKRSPKGKGKGKGPPDGVPPGPPDGVPPGPPKGIK